MQILIVLYQVHAWNFTTNGVYTMKSGYKVGMDFFYSQSASKGTSSTPVET